MTNALGFFASVIKSGEKWSEECDKMLRAAFDTKPHPDAPCECAEDAPCERARMAETARDIATKREEHFLAELNTLKGKSTPDAAARDTARLDWLESIANEAIEIESFIGDNPEKNAVFIEWAWDDMPPHFVSEYGKRIAAGRSLREALDNAEAEINRRREARAAMRASDGVGGER